MSVNEEIREQRKKLKDQSFKAKLEYFWEYYKIHTIVAIIAIFFISILIRDISNRKPYALYAMMINARGMELQDQIETGFANYSGIDESQETILVDTSATFSMANMDNATVATSEKIMAVMAASDLDVLVADRSTFGHYSSLDTYMDLRNIYTESELSLLQEKNLIYYVDQGYIDYVSSEEYSSFLTNGQFDENNKYAVMAAEYEETGIYPEVDFSEMDTPIPLGIILKDSEIMATTGAYPDEAPVAGITINTQRLDRAQEFVEYLMK